MRGRKPLPTEVKKSRGTLQKCRTLENEIKAAKVDAIPVAPEFLGDLGKNEWGKVCTQLFSNGILAEADLTLLSAYCSEMETYLEAEILLRQNGRVIKAPSGYPMPHPYVAIARQALKAAKEIAVLFGLTPSAKTRVGSNPAIETDPFSEMKLRKSA